MDFIRGISVFDRVAVLDLYSRQSQAVDASDGAVWSSTFTTDGVFTSVTYSSTRQGREALAEFAVSSNTAAASRGERYRHHISDVVLEFVDEGELSSIAYLIITATTAEGTRIDRSVVIYDRLVRVDGEWLVAERRTERD